MLSHALQVEAHHMSVWTSHRFTEHDISMHQTAPVVHGCPDVQASQPHPGSGSQGVFHHLNLLRNTLPSLPDLLQHTVEFNVSL